MTFLLIFFVGVKYAHMHVCMYVNFALAAKGLHFLTVLCALKWMQTILVWLINFFFSKFFFIFFRYAIQFRVGYVCFFHLRWFFLFACFIFISRSTGKCAKQKRDEIWQRRIVHCSAVAQSYLVFSSRCRVNVCTRCCCWFCCFWVAAEQHKKKQQQLSYIPTNVCTYIHTNIHMYIYSNNEFYCCCLSVL